MSPIEAISRTRHSSHRKCKSNKPAAGAPNQSLSAAVAASSTGSVQWLDLPRQLVNLMAAAKPTMFKDVSSHCVTKSWQRPSPPKFKCCKSNLVSTLPQLQLITHHHDQTSSTFPGQFISTYPIPTIQGYTRWIGHKYNRPQNQTTRRLIGFSKGMMFRSTYMSESPTRYDLFNAEDYPGSWGILNPWEAADQPFYRPQCYACLQPRVLMVLTGLPVPAFAYSRIGIPWDHSWKKHDSVMVDPNGTSNGGGGGGRYMILCNGVWLRRKLYALSLQGTLAVIEEDNKDGFRIGAVCKQGRAVPCGPFKQFRECLVESGGEVLLVFLVFKKCMERVDEVEVYSLVVGKLEWVRRQSLGGGDRALFFGTNCCVSVGAPWEVGVACRRNCVYFKANYFDEWSEYDLETRTILPFPSLDSGVDCSY